MTAMGGENGWNLLRIDPADGSVIWNYSPYPSNGMSPPTVGPDGSVYFSRSLSYLDSVTPAGTPRWTFFDGSIVDLPAVSPDGQHRGGGRPARVRRAWEPPRLGRADRGACLAGRAAAAQATPTRSSTRARLSRPTARPLTSARRPSTTATRPISTRSMRTAGRRLRHRRLAASATSTTTAASATAVPPPPRRLRLRHHRPRSSRRAPSRGLSDYGWLLRGPRSGMRTARSARSSTPGRGSPPAESSARPRRRTPTCAPGRVSISSSAAAAVSIARGTAA